MYKSFTGSFTAAHEPDDYNTRISADVEQQHLFRRLCQKKKLKELGVSKLAR